jgi:ABC-type Fe3+ transport system substrate-binding protein
MTAIAADWPGISACLAGGGRTKGRNSMSGFGNPFRRGFAVWQLVIVLSIMAHGASAASLAEIAMMSGSDRQARLEAGAKAEGELNLYTTLIVDQALLPLKAAFEKKYPFIKFNYTRNSSEQLVIKIFSETRAGKPNSDVVVGSTESALNTAGLLEPFTSPNVSVYPSEFIGTNRMWVDYRLAYYGIGYNPKLLPEADAPKGWEDLANPKLKGKMIWNDSEEGAQLIIAHLRHIWGKQKAGDFFDKLASLDVAASTASRRAILDLVIAGEYSIMIGATLQHVMISKNQGAPVWFASPDPVVARPDSVQLPKESRHPHAAMLFIDFLLGKEGQEVLAKAEYLPGNPTVEPLPQIRPIVPYLNGKKIHVIDETEMSPQREEIKTIFEKVSR